MVKNTTQNIEVNGTQYILPAICAFCRICKLPLNDCSLGQNFSFSFTKLDKNVIYDSDDAKLMSRINDEICVFSLFK